MPLVATLSLALLVQGAPPPKPPAKPPVKAPPKPPVKSAPKPPAAKALATEDLVVGKGTEAKVGDVVEMEYVGTLAAGGKEFDRSKGQPFRFQIGVGQVIKGWDLGIPGLREGGERRLLIPASLGYGAQGSPPDIGPNADLVFKVKLVRVHPRATFETLAPGAGETVHAGDGVEFDYKGTLPDGKVFDSSYDRKQPLQIEMRGMIPGVNQGLIGMKVGEKRRIVVPSDLAYGENGVPRQDVTDPQGKVTPKGSIIPGGATITFEVEMRRVLRHAE